MLAEMCTFRTADVNLNLIREKPRKITFDVSNQWISIAINLSEFWSLNLKFITFHENFEVLPKAHSAWDFCNSGCVFSHAFEIPNFELLLFTVNQPSVWRRKNIQTITIPNEFHILSTNGMSTRVSWFFLSASEHHLKYRGKNKGLHNGTYVHTRISFKYFGIEKVFCDIRK